MRSLRLLAFALLAAACSDGGPERIAAPDGAVPRPNHIVEVSACCPTALYHPGGGTQVTMRARDASGTWHNVSASWSSGNTAVATVDGNGFVRTVGLGDAAITGWYEGRSSTVVIGVFAAPRVHRVVVSPASLTVQVGSGYGLTAKVYDQYGNTMNRTVTWSSDAPGVAAVNSSGSVSGVALGSTTVRATVDGVQGSASVTVEPYLGARIEGPDMIYTEGEHTWQVFPEGGNGSYTYQWSVEYVYGTGTELLGAWHTQSYNVTGSTPPFLIVATVRSGTQTIRAEKYVCNLIANAWC